MDVTAIVMAAGEGTRMKSNHAKVSHQILGKPMACWVIDAALAAGCTRVVVVVGSHSDEVRALISAAYEGTPAADAIECVEQVERCLLYTSCLYVHRWNVRQKQWEVNTKPRL